MTVNGSKDLSGDIFIARREFMGNIQASATVATLVAQPQSLQSQFSLTAFNINPGLVGSFPWLSQVAKNFTLYEFEGLIYEYKPLSGEAGNLNTNSLGKVVMATQYDPDAPSFASTIQMENYDYATACKPAEHMLHGVETKSKQRQGNMLYVRSGFTSKDEILTDIGDFQIATEGIPLVAPTSAPVGTVITTTVGELWVAYKVRLSRANIFQNVGSNIPADIHLWTHTAGANPAIGGTPAAVAALGGQLAATFNLSGSAAMAVPKRTNTVGTQVTTNGNTAISISWPAGSQGTYLVCGQMTDTDAELCGFSLPVNGTAADIVTAQAAGLTTPGVIGALAPAVCTFAFGAINTTPGVATHNGLQQWSARETTVGGCFTFYVTFSASANQLPIINLNNRTGGAFAGAVFGSIQVIPVPFSLLV